MNTIKEWRLLELSDFCENEDSVVDFLLNRGLIPQNMNCPNCGWGMKIFLKGKYWKCYKTIKTKKGKKICGKTITINKNSWLSKTKLNYKQALMLVYMIIHNYEQQAIARDLKINKSTVSQWNNFIRRVTIEWLNNNAEPIGGEGKIVEIDESEFGKSKYNRGKVLEGQWVVGGFCRETKKMFMVPVEDRTSANLISVIKQWVLPGSAIISNRWNLSQEEYEYLTLNYSITFIDRESGVHNNTIKCMWRHAKEFLPRPYRKKMLPGYLAHFLFKNDTKKKNKDLFECILKEISEMKFDESLNLDEGNEDESEEEEEFEFFF